MMPPNPLSRNALRTGRLPVVRLLAVLARALAAALAATVTVPAVRAAEPPLPTADSVPDQPAKPPAPRAEDPAVQARLPGCSVWTDRCVTCTRDVDRITCSNIGISCQPQALECVRSDHAQENTEEKAEEKKDEEGRNRQN